jgi:hypothetical protein
VAFRFVFSIYLQYLNGFDALQNKNVQDFLRIDTAGHDAGTKFRQVTNTYSGCHKYVPFVIFVNKQQSSL